MKSLIESMNVASDSLSEAAEKKPIFSQKFVDYTMSMTDKVFDMSEATDKIGKAIHATTQNAMSVKLINSAAAASGALDDLASELRNVESYARKNGVTESISESIKLGNDPQIDLGRLDEAVTTLEIEDVAQMVALALFAVKSDKMPITFANLHDRFTMMMPDAHKGTVRQIAKSAVEMYSEMLANQ